MALRTLIDPTQQCVKAHQAYKGNVAVVSRDSKTDSLFDMNRATFNEDDSTFNHANAGGFIKLNVMRMRNAAIAREKRGK